MHYALLTCYYPTAGIAWALGALNGILYFSANDGTSGLELSPSFTLDRIDLRRLMPRCKRRHDRLDGSVADRQCGWAVDWVRWLSGYAWSRCSGT